MIRRKGYRLITVGFKTWQYCIGSGYVEAICEDGVRKCDSLSVVTHLTWDNIDRARHKRYFSVTPKQIAAWLA